MSRTLEDIQRMAKEDYEIGLKAHYKPLADFINTRKYKTGVEIGTAYAGNAAHLLANTRLDKLITVDPYLYYDAMPGLEGQDDYERLFLFAYHRLSLYSNCTMLRCTNKRFFEALYEAKIDGISKSYDFFFLDGDHSFENLLSECREASKYIKKGGALMGHDIDIFESVNLAVSTFADEIHGTVFILPGNIWYINFD